jgi:hypothetical protein
MIVTVVCSSSSSSSSSRNSSNSSTVLIILRSWGRKPSSEQSRHWRAVESQADTPVTQPPLCHKRFDIHLHQGWLDSLNTSGSLLYRDSNPRSTGAENYVLSDWPLINAMCILSAGQLDQIPLAFSSALFVWRAVPSASSLTDDSTRGLTSQYLLTVVTVWCMIGDLYDTRDSICNLLGTRKINSSTCYKPHTKLNDVISP